MHVNELGQPVGRPLPGWQPPPLPPRTSMQGRFCRVVPIDQRFAPELFESYAADREGRTWTYLPYGPFTTEHEYVRWMRETCFGADPMFYAVVDGASGRARGVAAHLRIDANAGSIEVGHIHFSPAMQRTPVATESMYLMMQRVFALGYRRYEWKCDALNATSRAAAERLGFQFEGIFRQARVYKGRNRDTAWYSIVDGEWPALARAFETWLSPDNFDDARQQRLSLSALTRAVRREPSDTA
jgi:RimJ/RimL family protein N-acetyltransferase